jgi:hypothetical protein
VAEIFDEDCFKVSSGDDEELVEALVADGAHEPLRESVRRSRQLHLMETVRPEPSG